MNADQLNFSNDPLQQFKLWFKQALENGLEEVNAMNLATVGKNGQPSIRAVLLKSYDERGFIFYTNYKSQKALEIEENPKVALQFLWIPLKRQIRIEGIAEKTTIEESAEYFATRSRSSQISAWTSKQSSPIESRLYLEAEFIKNLEKFKDKTVPLPPFWGGYRVKPISYEFWKEGLNRLHDRILYSKQDSLWTKIRLAP